MNKAIAWGIGLLAAAALCGFLNVAGAYADDGKAAMGILAAVLVLISLTLFYNGMKKRTASLQDISPVAQSQQQYQPPLHLQAQPPPPPQSSGGGVLFVPLPLDEQNRPGER